MTTNYSWSQFENCIKELSPYVKERLVKATSLEMSEIEKHMKESYNDDKKFKKLINEVFGDLGKVVPSDKRIAKKILDLDLWFTISYQLRVKQGKERKFIGRLFEIVAESVLKAYLNRERLSYEFVDYDPVDYMILNNHDVICEISCKTVLSTDKRSPYYYDEHANIVANRLKGQTKKFVVFCACAYLDQKNCIRERFDRIDNCRLFYLWNKIGNTSYESSAYIIDESFHNFIDFIKNLQ